jgi:hypothetical protein
VVESFSCSFVVDSGRLAIAVFAPANVAVDRKLIVNDAIQVGGESGVMSQHASLPISLLKLSHLVIHFVADTQVCGSGSATNVNCIDRAKINWT